MHDEIRRIPNDLAALWMPFTWNRDFKERPRLIASAKGVHCTTVDGRELLDAGAGLWCVNAGHGDPRITKAIQEQAATLDYTSPFQGGHPAAFELASRIAEIAPGDLNHVFFTNSGSESVETALKVAIAYQRIRGEAGRFRLIGREKGYHGVNFGGISVGGMVKNRMYFGSLLAGVDHLRHTHLPDKNAFSRGQPDYGADLADDLERMVALHGPGTIAAVIVEPVAGSAGVLVPPKGYLERLREICTKHGILLIFDEVITGFGRLGAPFASDFFDIQPDIMTMAKGLTNGAVPMGACVVSSEIYDAFMNGPEPMIELFHGYTYSGHPLACAAGLAALDVYRDDDLFAHAAEVAPYLEDAVHSFAGHEKVVDVRNMGMMGAIELAPGAEGPGRRGYNSLVASYEAGLLIRVTGDSIALSPPLTFEPKHIDQTVEVLRKVIDELD